MLSVSLVVLLSSMGCNRSADFEALEELDGVFGVPNIDDDNDNGTRDFNDEGARGDNDLAELSIKDLIRNGKLVLQLTGDLENLRVWADGDVLLDADETDAEFEADDLPESLEVEFGSFLAEGELRMWHVSNRGKELANVDLRLLAAPLILNHHLQPVERSYVIEDQFYNTNRGMVADMRTVLGNTLAAPPYADFGFDQWVQDEFETGTLTAPGGRIDVVVDSIRSSGNNFLDSYPERIVADAPNSVVRTWGGRAYPTSQDSFGNLEVTPPFTVDGVEYPFGKVYWGDWERNRGPVGALRTMLEAQRVQDPFAIDVSWLCVGHVDEFMTFLPDPSANKGWRLYVADTDLGFAFLEGLDPSTELHPRYEATHDVRTVGELVDSLPLRDVNDSYQVDYIEPTIDQLRTEMGLVNDDIVRVPALFEEVGYCGGYAAALIPGTVNMLVVTGENGESTLILPDPFLRGAGQPQNADPFIAEINRLLPAAGTPVWVDNWDLYHALLGEVHCGTNTTRTPTAQWWTDALHLIDGGE